MAVNTVIPTKQKVKIAHGKMPALSLDRGYCNSPLGGRRRFLLPTPWSVVQSARQSGHGGQCVRYWNREAVKKLVRSYEDHGWVTSAERSDLVTLIENQSEDEVITKIKQITEANK